MFFIISGGLCVSEWYVNAINQRQVDGVSPGDTLDRDAAKIPMM